MVKHYNATGAPALADQRHRNAGAAPLLDAAGRQALDAALRKSWSEAFSARLRSLSALSRSGFESFRRPTKSFMDASEMF